MLYVFKITTMETNESPKSKTVTSKPYKDRDKAANAMLKALKATDVLNELGLTNIPASGRVEEVTA